MKYNQLLLKWIFLCLLLSLIIGSISSGFLYSLNWATNYRENHQVIIWFLPLAGFCVGFIYCYYGKTVQGGNNLLIETILNPKRIIPFKMSYLVYAGTILTHLFGGSAGREGTALQMAGAVADQLSKPFKLSSNERRGLIMAAIAGGFGAVFGAPFTGSVFALELLIIGKINLKAVMPSLATALGSNLVCKWWNTPHTHYHITALPSVNFSVFILVALAGLAFGLCALLFSRSMHALTGVFKKIPYAPFRPAIGGLIILLGIYIFQTSRYVGLGIPEIVNSFKHATLWYDFVLKIVFTVITLSSGFKGGEVTPLFFIGATLGSALSFWLPLPTSFLAGLGFVAVFSGATNTPLACTIMAAELFGIKLLPYAFVVCITAYLSSGNIGIYAGQIIYGKKRHRYLRLINKGFKNL